jgi:Tfp pilus assembly protein PilP
MKRLVPIILSTLLLAGCATGATNDSAQTVSQSMAVAKSPSVEERVMLSDFKNCLYLQAGNFNPPSMFVSQIIDRCNNFRPKNFKAESMSIEYEFCFELKSVNYNPPSRYIPEIRNDCSAYTS